MTYLRACARGHEAERGTGHVRKDKVKPGGAGRSWTMGRLFKRFGTKEAICLLACQLGGREDLSLISTLLQGGLVPWGSFLAGVAGRPSRHLSKSRPPVRGPTQIQCFCPDIQAADLKETSRHPRPLVISRSDYRFGDQ